MYLRIIVHANEHMGQLIGYARMSGVVHLGQTLPGSETDDLGNDRLSH